MLGVIFQLFDKYRLQTLLYSSLLLSVTNVSDRTQVFADNFRCPWHVAYFYIMTVLLDHWFTHFLKFSFVMLSNANVMCRSSFSLFQGLECVYVHMDGGEGCFISSCGTDQLIRAVGFSS